MVLGRINTTQVITIVSTEVLGTPWLVAQDPPVRQSQLDFGCRDDAQLRQSRALFRSSSTPHLTKTTKSGSQESVSQTERRRGCEVCRR